MNQTPIRILGAPGSPYSRKMRAVARYRRIPYRWILRNSKDDRDNPDVPVALIPILIFPDDSAMIDSSFQIERLEELFEGRSLRHPAPAMSFLMGGRPGLGDFGLFGQLTQLGLFDPTPVAVAHEESIRALAWIEIMEDLSGYEVGAQSWLKPKQAAEHLTSLLKLVGRYYAPFLLGNAAALESGADQVDCEIAGQPWRQQPFPYQGKCLRWLRESYTALAESDRRAVDQILANTGCDSLFTN